MVSSPSGQPITQGSLLDFPHDPLAVMKRLHQAHGPIAALDDGEHRLVFLFSPRYNQQVLSDPATFHSQFFAIRGPKNSAQRRLTSGLLSMNGEDYKRHRRLVMGPFQKKSIEQYRDELVGLAEEMIRDWQPGQKRDIFRDMTHYMLRVTASILFGYDQADLALEIGRLTERWVAMNHELGMGAFVADENITARYDHLLAIADELEAQIRALISCRRSSSELGNDVLSLLIRARDESGKGLTDAELIGQAAVLFGAAHLTSANTLTWTLFLLSQHPQVAEELCQELQSTLHGQAPTMGQMDELPLLDRVIKESMRILPASAYSQRTAAMPVRIGPLDVAAATPVIFSQIMTHHMPDLFPEPERFLPDRWLTISPSPYAYFPFAAGPRMCIGAALAMVTFKMTLPIILQRFRLQVLPDADINGKVIYTMFTPTSGMPMVVSPSSGSFASSPIRGNIHAMVTLDEGGHTSLPQAA